MRPQTVHAKTDYSEILATPVESAVKVPLLLTATVLCACNIVEEMASRQANESDTILELMSKTDGLDPAGAHPYENRRWSRFAVRGT